MTAILDLPHTEPPRDRYQRPVIDGITYTRASSLAKALSDGQSLIAWNARITALGLAKSEDLIAALATTDPDNKTALNKIVEQAKERAQSKAKATIGTAIHAATETLDRGGNLNGLPDKVKGDALAYRAAIDAHGLTPLAAELFVVNKEVQAAGTLDRLLQGPNRVVVGDIKTSGNPDTAKYAAVEWAIQIATYARSKPWLPGRGVVEWADLGLPEPDIRRGVVVHIVQGTGEVRLHSVDLTTGWIAAQLAADVLAVRKSKPATPIP